MQSLRRCGRPEACLQQRKGCGDGSSNEATADECGGADACDVVSNAHAPHSNERSFRIPAPKKSICHDLTHKQHIFEGFLKAWLNYKPFTPSYPSKSQPNIEENNKYIPHPSAQPNSKNHPVNTKIPPPKHSSIRGGDPHHHRAAVIVLGVLAVTDSRHASNTETQSY